MSILAATLPKLDTAAFPEIDLRQIFALTDDTGILQHATHSTANLECGYCTDDVARALIVHATTRWILTRDGIADTQRKLRQVTLPIQRALAFVSHAFSPQSGRFRNFMTYDRRWIEEIGSEDCHGRALWALGTVLAYPPNEPVRQQAQDLMIQAMPAFNRIEHVRPVAFGLIGLYHALREREHSEMLIIQREKADWLLAQWRKNATPEWPWWEDILTWGNAKLCSAMMVSGSDLDRPEMIDAGLESLRWLVEVQKTPQGHFSLIGNKGWYPRGGQKALFDQQPLDAEALGHACLCAARVTGEAIWVQEARRAFDWFCGRNDLGISLYHPETGGCQDGLNEMGVNLNQGAESTLAYILSVLDLHLYALEQDETMPPVIVRTADDGSE